MRRRSAALLAASAAVLGAAAPAPAATKLETHRESRSVQASFAGDGCDALDTETLQLAPGAFDVTGLEPITGARLTSASSGDDVARVDSILVEDDRATWTVRGSDAACAPGREAARWDTAIVTLRADYLVRRRVLTRRTVIRRGDRICRSSGRRLRRVERRLDRADSLREVAGALRGFARLLRGTRRRLAALEVPRDRADSFRRFVAGVDRAQARIGRAADAVEELDVRALRRQVRRAMTALVLAGRHARRYGFRVCGAGFR